MRRTILIAFALLLCAAAPAHGTPQRPLQIDVISNRADLISAGEALVAVKVRPRRVDAGRIRVFDDDREVTEAFAVRPNGRFEGLVTGLELGRNVLRARVRPAKQGEVRAPVRRRLGKIVVHNHPNGGPVFSGPQVDPWVCQASAVDEQCNQDASYDFQYSSTDGSLKDYDPDSPPGDVATTTTDEGVEVPFIIRIETGYQDRDQYKIAVLYDPAQPWEPWAPQEQWNHKLLITHGASCGIDHEAGEAPSVTGDTAGVPGAPGAGNSPTTALSRGFAVMSTALNNAGHNCSLVTQAESMVMAKERLVEEYGEIRYTIGTGCSGGSLTQQQVANAYPGIYQGILPQCSFPDAWSTGQQLVDYHLLRLYFEDPSKWGLGVQWLLPAQIAAVEGHPNHVNSIILDSLYWTALADPTNACAGVSDAERYHPDTNPGGERCTLADYMVNVFGPRPQGAWGPQEQEVGHGFVKPPLDNVGVQYGLEALERGEILPSQFVDLNAKVGGGDIDINFTPERLEADPGGLRNSYISGAVNSANNLDEVAIIDLRGPDPGAFHDAYRSFTVRERIEREHGTFANHVLWYGQAPLIGDPAYTTEGLIAMDRWLAAVEADGSDKPLSQKILDDRPADIVDRCSQADGLELVDVPGVGPVCQLEQVQTKYGTPRTVAGEALTTDQQKCQLKPLVRAEYPVVFTDPEWTTLQATFPGGVCDWSQPGVDQQGTIPWRSYQDEAGEVVYGGRSLGAAPGGSGAGWTSPSFAGWRAAETG